MGIIGGGVAGAFYFMEKQAKVQAETALEAVRPEIPHLLIYLFSGLSRLSSRSTYFMDPL